MGTGQLKKGTGQNEKGTCTMSDQHVPLSVPPSLSNYQKLCIKWQQDFTTWDQEGICESLNITDYTSDTIFLQYFQHPYSINRHSGQLVDIISPERELPFSTQMAIYHLFFYSKKSPVNSGVWVPFRDVKGAAPFDSAFKRQILTPFAQAFSGKAELLKRRGEELGFVPIKHGDVGFYAEAFSCMPLQFIFWDGDEEFPAQANILFDKNITDFTHEETVVLIAEDGIDLLMNRTTTR